MAAIDLSNDEAYCAAILQLVGEPESPPEPPVKRPPGRRYYMTAKELRRLALDQEHYEKVGVVYYGRAGNGDIKIGATTNLLSHARVLRSRYAMEVLATEPGYFKKERARHKQFARERRGRAEFFEPSKRLLAHIERLKKKEDDRYSYD